MNLREKLGQRFLYRLPDVTHLTPKVADFLVECRAGGVVLFGYNVKTPDQVAELNRDLQTLAAREGLPPFIISVDEEGGQVSRMPAQGQELIIPSQMALGVAGAAAVQACAAANARRLRRLGFNLNYAPVLDINNNPANPVIGTRSFGDVPQMVAEMGAVAIQAYLENGLSPCVKHFPGHGDTDVDSHFGMPVVEKSLAELHDFELIPFQRAIEVGVPAIMTAHIHYPQVEAEDRPATFSPRFLIRLLREQMGFDGLIFTDALDMRAVTERYGLGKASLLALQAGADVIMSFSHSFEEQRAAFERVVSAAEAGEFDLSGTAETLGRLANWRNRFCHQTIPPDPALADAALIAQAARSGLSVVHSNGATGLPLSGLAANKPLLIDFVTEMESPVEEGRQSGPILERQLRERFPALLRLEAPADPAPADVERIQTWAAQSDLLIIVIRQTRRYPVQARLVKSLLETCQPPVPVVLVAAREPYDLELFKAAPVSIATYGDPPATIKALAGLLGGE